MKIFLLFSVKEELLAKDLANNIICCIGKKVHSANSKVI